MRGVAIVAAVGAIVALLLVACGGDDGEPADQNTGAVSSATGPGLSIKEAIESDLEGHLLVNGFLLAEGDDLRFCSGLTDSNPPGCAGDSLKIAGLDLAQVEGLQAAEGRRWSDEIQLLGEVEGDTLKVRQDVTA